MRDGVRNLCANVKRLYHLGVASVTRSTFADANRNRPVEVFGGLLGKLYQRFCQVAPGHKFRFKAQLFSLDASTVKLNRNTYPWANFRKNKGGIKIHTLLDHNGYGPSSSPTPSPMISLIDLHRARAFCYKLAVFFVIQGVYDYKTKGLSIRTS